MAREHHQEFHVSYHTLVASRYQILHVSMSRPSSEWRDLTTTLTNARHAQILLAALPKSSRSVCHHIMTFCHRVLCLCVYVYKYLSCYPSVFTRVTSLTPICEQGKITMRVSSMFLRPRTLENILDMHYHYSFVN